MVDLEYIILKSKGTRSQNTNARGPTFTSASSTPGGIEIVEDRLSTADRSRVQSEATTLAIAPKMQMKLLEPVGDPADAPQSSDPTWGIVATNTHTSPYDGTGIKVGVIDTGIDPNHPAFTGVTFKHKNYTDGADNDTSDTDGHGTHCAGTIFGRDVDGTRIGVARGVTEACIAKVLGQGGAGSLDVAKAVQWCVDQGAHVVSMSLGIDFPGFVAWLQDRRGLRPEAATTLGLEAYRENVNMFSELSSYVAASSAFRQGTLIVAASGNESQRPDYEIAAAPPSVGTGVLSVGAIGQKDSQFGVAAFSNIECDVVGPGVNVVSAKPGGGLVALNGTSMATPHVAGIAALWAQRLQINSGRVSGNVLSANVIASATRESFSPEDDTQDVGEGLIQAPQD